MELTKFMDVALSLTDDDVCKKNCLGLVTKIRPQWNVGDLKFKFFTNGITNKIFCCYPLSSDGRDRLVFRVYGAGTELIIDRCAELRNWQRLAVNECASPIYGVFANGIVCGYQPGEVLDSSSVRSDVMYPKIAASLVKMHKIKTDEKSPKIWSMLQSFVNNVPDQWEDEAKGARIRNNYYTKDELLSEIKHMRSVVESLDEPITFCHNDLLLHNILYDEDTGGVHFIDYEYAAPNYRAFDIANHFCEYAGVDSIDFSRFPSPAYQRKWIESYLRASNANHATVDDAALDKLCKSVSIFAPIAHFHWSVWAMVQAANSTIDFDYMQYGLDKMAEYRKMKHMIRL